jgi:hypothetical protein
MVTKRYTVLVDEDERKRQGHWPEPFLVGTYSGWGVTVENVETLNEPEDVQTFLVSFTTPAGLYGGSPFNAEEIEQAVKETWHGMPWDKIKVDVEDLDAAFDDDWAEDDDEVQAFVDSFGSEGWWDR